MTVYEKVLKSGEDDWMYLAEIASFVREEMPDSDEETVFEYTLRVLYELTNDGFVVIGDLSHGKFVPWPLSTSEALMRVRNEWKAMNRPISISDVCWISNTPSGDKRASLLPTF